MTVDERALIGKPESDIPMRFGMHESFVNALDAGNHQRSFDFAFTPAQRGVVFAVRGDFQAAVDVFRNGSLETTVSLEQRGLAGMFFWLSETGKDRERTDREHKKAISDYFADNESFPKDLHALEQRGGTLPEGSKRREANELCQYMLQFQRENGDFVEGFQRLSRTSTSIYVAGFASLMMAAYYFLRLPENSKSKRLHYARTSAVTKLFSELGQKAKEFDNSSHTVSLSPYMTDVDVATVTDDTAPKDWVGVERVLMGIPEEHLPKAAKVIAEREKEAERRKRLEVALEVALDMARGLFPDLASEDCITGQDLTNQFAAASKRDPSEFKGEAKKQAYVDLVKAFRDAEASVRLDGTEVRLGLKTPFKKTEKVFATMLPVRGAKNVRTFWTPPPLKFAW